MNGDLMLLLTHNYLVNNHCAMILNILGGDRVMFETHKQINVFYATHVNKIGEF